jgi:hypothetical protein
MLVYTSALNQPNVIVNIVYFYNKIIPNEVIISIKKKQMVNVNIPLSIIVAQENTHENLMASGRDFFLWLMIIFVFSMCTPIQK